MQSFMTSVKQIGYAVKDLDETLRRFQAVNGEEHEFWRFQTTMDADCADHYRGRPAVCRLDVALTTINGMDHEFIQALSGQHPAGDFVEEHGEGINHLALYLADLSEYRDQALALGGRIVASGEFREGTSPARRFAYIGFDGQPSPLYELVELRDLAKGGRL